MIILNFIYLLMNKMVFSYFEKKFILVNLHILKNLKKFIISLDFIQII